MMSDGQPSEDSVLSRAARALGISDPAALAGQGCEWLARFTRRQLLESAKALGLRGISKLRKDDLAAQLWDVLEKATAAGRAMVEEAGHVVLGYKFELGPQAPVREAPQDIPWSYGWDRVTAMAVDPDRLYVYWEVTDAAIERARAQLGPGGPGAWLDLRVYDVTGRIFDGTNAHGYVDHRVERGDRQWFFDVGRPASEALVEIGMKSDEGYFVKIARSGRVEFPRREPVPWAEPEWLTVRAGGLEVEHVGRGTPAGPPPPPAPRFEAIPLWQVLHAEGGEWAGDAERVEWEEIVVGDEIQGHQLRWEGPVLVSAWEAGPFTYPVEAAPPSREESVGGTRVYRVGGRVHVVHGPWQVVIRGLGAHVSRRVLARWEMHRAWVSTEEHEVRGGRPAGSSERAAGASERRLRGASELRLGGASEVYYLGASEIARRGASERMYLGASERRLRGASEQLVRGASENLSRGASERLLRGASEHAFPSPEGRPGPPRGQG